MQRRHVNAIILAIDIRGFTPLCEKIKLKKAGRLIDEYFSIVRNALDKVSDGDCEIRIDRFLGDGFLIFIFDGDGGCTRAVEAAFDIRTTFKKKIQAEYGHTNAGIGIAIGKGEILYGKFGEECPQDSKLFPKNWQGELTGIGPQINKTFRMLNEAAKDQILVSDEVKKDISDDYIWTELDSLLLKGIKEPIIPFLLFRKGKWDEKRYCCSSDYCRYYQYCRKNYDFGQSHRELSDHIPDKWLLTQKYLCDERIDGKGNCCAGCDINKITLSDPIKEGCNVNYVKGKKKQFDSRICCSDCKIYHVCNFNLNRGKNHRPKSEEQMKKKMYCCDRCTYFSCSEDECIQLRIK